MINLLIYSGLGCLLLGSILGLIAAIKGFALNNYKIELITRVRDTTYSELSSLKSHRLRD